MKPNLKGPVFFVITIGLLTWVLTGVFGIKPKIGLLSEASKGESIDNSGWVRAVSPEKLYAINHSPEWESSTLEVEEVADFGRIIDSISLTRGDPDQAESVSVLALEDLTQAEFLQVINCEIELFECRKQDFNGLEFTLIYLPLMENPNQIVYGLNEGKLVHLIIVDNQKSGFAPSAEIQTMLNTLEISK